MKIGYLVWDKYYSDFCNTLVILEITDKLAGPFNNKYLCNVVYSSDDTLLSIDGRVQRKLNDTDLVPVFLIYIDNKPIPIGT